MKSYRHQLGKHVLFVGSRAILQPYEATVEDMLQTMALEWAGDAVAELPPDRRAPAALEAFAEHFPDGAQRAARFAERIPDLRPSEGHVQLARLIKDGYVPLLFTMSPDDSLEQALRAQRLVAGQDYHCVVAGADSVTDIEVAVRESTRVVVVKCGGDISRKVLPLTPDEIAQTIAPISELIRDVFRRVVVFSAYGERDRPFLHAVPRDGDKVYWVNLHIPVAEPDALEEMRLESPDAEEYHKLQPEVIELLRARNSQRNLLCREQGRFTEFFGRVYERVRRRRRTDHYLRRGGLTVQRTGPFKFLEAYETHDADFFYGREVETKALAELVGSRSLVTLFGELAVGKTSLLRAGLIPKLEAESKEADGREQLPWLTVYVRCGADVAGQVVRALAIETEAAGFDAQAVVDAQDIPAAVRACRQISNHQPVILVDNVHELFLKLSQSARRDFAAQIAQATGGEEPLAHVILSLREDYLGELYEVTDALPSAFHHLLRLRRFTREQAEDAIVKAAGSFGLQFDREVVAQMLEDLDRQGILPAHLQIVCYTLVEAAGPTRRYIGPLLYNKLGGARRILRDHLSRRLGQLGPADRRLAWSVLRTLAEASETLAALPVEELAEAVSGQRQALDRVLARLEDLRLVRPLERNGGRHVELVHELLAEEIRSALAKGQPPTAQTAHDILARGIDNFHATGQVLERGEMHRVDDERGDLTLSAQELELAIRSSVEDGISPEYWLGRLGELRQRKYAVLADMLASEDARVRQLALDHAKEHLAAELIEPLTRLAERGGEEGSQAIELLKSMRSELVAGLSAPDAEQRAWAARAIGLIRGRQLRELVEALDDRYPEATDAIADAIARVNAAAGVKLLIRRLTQGDKAWAAAEALGRLGHESSLLPAIERATARHADSPLLAYAYALALMRQRRYEEAMEVLDRAVRLAEPLKVSAEPLRQALRRCEQTLARSRRGEDKWPHVGRSPAHTNFVPETLKPPLEEFWTRELDAEIAGQPVAARGTVVAVTRDGGVVGLDIASGEEMWRASAGGRLEVSPALVDEHLVVATTDGRVVVFSLSGRQESSLDVGLGPRSSLTTAEGRVLFGTRSGEMIGVDLSSHDVRVLYKFSDEITGPVTYADGVVFAGSWDATVAAVELATGELRWLQREDSPVAGAVPLDRGTAFWTTDGGTVAAATADNGRVIWRTELPSGSRTSPAVSPDLVLVGCLDGVVRALDRRDGKLRGEFMTGDQILCAPLIVGDVAYVASRDGSIYAVSLTTGQEQWRYTTSYGVYVTPVFVEGTLIAVLRQRQVVAFAPREEVSE